MKQYLQITALIVTTLASAAASLVMMHFSCYATVCPEDYFSYETRLHVIIYYCFLSLTLCLLALRSYSPAVRSFTNIQPLPRVSLLGNGFTLGEAFMTIWILVLTFGPTIYWFPTHWDFWGRRLDGLSWVSAKIQLTITGVTGHYDDVLLGLLIIPVSRNSLVGQAFSVHHGTLLFAHRLIAYLFSIAVAAHGITYIVYATDGSSEGDKAKEEALATGNPTMTLSESKQRSSWFVQTTYTGIAAFLTILAILVTSLPYTRRQHYNLFYYTHVICGIIIFVASCIHASTDFYLLLPGLLLWIGDWVRRVFFGEINGLSRKTVATLENIGGSWIRISLPAKSTPQQMMEKPVPTSEPLLYYHINAPRVSKFQIHAFTAAVPTSISHGPRFLIQRASGKPQKILDKEWTWKLGARVPNVQDSRDLEIRLEGPYRINDAGYINASHILCIVGGSGVTGALSLARWWLDAGSVNGRFTLIWTLRTRESLEIKEWTDLVDIASTNSNLDIRSHISSENGRLDTALILRDAFTAQNVMAAAARGEGWVYSAGPDVLVKATERSCVEVRKSLKSSRNSGDQGAWALRDFSWYIEA
ncbi:ferric reductase [Fusarium phyllophilum]|uniref:Ferric reductase n=1 Tax=Fusarium phyllophilum TaxID=47803 RepID=A0A8H5J472_9HYPO|nr:ferric reductase [Fusarium phyllophilum]